MKIGMAANSQVLAPFHIVDSRIFTTRSSGMSSASSKALDATSINPVKIQTPTPKKNSSSPMRRSDAPNASIPASPNNSICV